MIDPALTNIAAGEHSVEYVPALLPPIYLAPEPARRVSFASGLFTYWLRPRRIGPHLAAESTFRALLASALALVIAVIAVACAAISKGLPAGLSAFTLRRAAAEGILDTAASTSNYWWAGLIPVGLILAVPLWWLLFIILGTFLLPWASAGDDLKSTWRRSVRNALWSGTILLPMTFAWTAVFLCCVTLAQTPAGTGILKLDAYNPFTVFDLGPTTILYGVIPLIGGLLFVRGLLFGASRYVGPATGPGFTPRTPICYNCGYQLVGLPTSTNCPECGLPVVDSLPGGRLERRHMLKRRGVAAWLEVCWRLHWRVWMDRKFLSRSPLLVEWPTARQSLAMTGMLLIISAMPAAVVTMLEFADDLTRIAIGAAVLISPLLLISIFLFATCAWGRMRFGIRELRVSLMIGVFGSAWLVPTFLIQGLAVMAGAYVERVWPRGAAIAGTPAEPQLLFNGLAFAVIPLGAVVAFIKTKRGLVAARYAAV